MAFSITSVNDVESSVACQNEAFQTSGVGRFVRPGKTVSCQRRDLTGRRLTEGLWLPLLRLELPHANDEWATLREVRRILIR